MKIDFKKRKNLILLLCITALAICLCCVFAACSKAQASSSHSYYKPSSDASVESEIAPENILSSDAAATRNYSRWLSDHYSKKIYTHEMWLSDMMDALDLSIADKTDSQTVFLTAYHNGIIDSPDEQPYSALTRRYVAQTLVNALGYSTHKIDLIDVSDKDTALSTVAYYGYFLPDEDGKIYPDAPVTVEEYNRLIDEVKRRHSLRGKTILSFGDSIMYGNGNHGCGIADLLGEKYGMTVYDYSVSGATFGTYKSRSHIPDQIKTACAEVARPDIILINGGTNDMSFVVLGKVSSGFEESSLDENTFAGGFEYSSLLLQTYWPDTPVVYIRAHDMNTVENNKEQQYGELSISLAEKWHLYCVDVFSDSDFCTERTEIRDAYTVYKEKLGHADGIHPTALGYTKYYLPLIAPEISSIIGR